MASTPAAAGSGAPSAAESGAPAPTVSEEIAPLTAFREFVETSSAGKSMGSLLITIGSADFFAPDPLHWVGNERRTAGQIRLLAQRVKDFYGISYILAIDPAFAKSYVINASFDGIDGMKKIQESPRIYLYKEKAYFYVLPLQLETTFAPNIPREMEERFLRASETKKPWLMADQCVPKEGSGYAFLFQMAKDIPFRAIFVHNSAWIENRGQIGTYYQNKYFENMCELLYILKYSEKPGYILDSEYLKEKNLAEGSRKKGVALRPTVYTSLLGDQLFEMEFRNNIYFEEVPFYVKPRPEGSTLTKRNLEALQEASRRYRTQEFSWIMHRNRLREIIEAYYTEKGETKEEMAGKVEELVKPFTLELFQKMEREKDPFLQSLFAMVRKSNTRVWRELEEGKPFFRGGKRKTLKKKAKKKGTKHKRHTK